MFMEKRERMKSYLRNSSESDSKKNISSTIASSSFPHVPARRTGMHLGSRRHYFALSVLVDVARFRPVAFGQERMIAHQKSSARPFTYF